MSIPVVSMTGCWGRQFEKHFCRGFEQTEPFPSSPYNPQAFFPLQNLLQLLPRCSCWLCTAYTYVLLCRFHLPSLLSSNIYVLIEWYNITLYLVFDPNTPKPNPLNPNTSKHVMTEGSWYMDYFLTSEHRRFINPDCRPTKLTMVSFTVLLSE